MITLKKVCFLIFCSILVDLSHSESNLHEILACRSGFWKCDSGLCIHESFRCDKIPNCPDDSDEKNCDGQSDSDNCTGANQFRCNDGTCIKASAKCDTLFDCNDGSDEYDCKEVCGGGFACKNGHCIEQHFKCDGEDDCGDDSDESNCGCDINDGFYRCKNNNCTRAERVCDGEPDCADGSDEGPGCEAARKDCAKCSHACVVTPAGAACPCSAGFGRLNATHCEDLDECALFHAHCSHACTNHPGSYACSCAHGYSLQRDNHTCRADGDAAALLLFTTPSEVTVYDLRTAEYSAVTRDAMKAIGVEYDGEYVYWSEVHGGAEAIMRATLDGKNQKPLVLNGIDKPEDLTIDWYTGNLYFTDANLRHIAVCSKDGAHCSVVISKGMDSPRTVVLNPAEGEMFWTDWGKRPEIAKAYMDGTNDKTIVSTNIHWPNGLTMDYPSDRLYWTDAKLNTIETVRPDGSHRRVVAQQLPHPFSIAIFEDTLYWSDWHVGHIGYCSKFDCPHRYTLVNEERFNGIHIYHPALTVRKPNSCDSNKCSHLCLLAGKNHTCACPEGKHLGDDGVGCVTEMPLKYVLVGVESTLIRIEHQILGGRIAEYKKFPELHFDYLIYDRKRDQIIVYDNFDKRIYGILKFFSDNPVVKTLVETGLHQVEGMDLDSEIDTLYWCDSGKGSVEVLSLSNGMRTTIYQSPADSAVPISVALVPPYGLMYVVVRSKTNILDILRMSMDGKGKIHEYKYDFEGPRISLYYQAPQQIFMAWSSKRKIYVLSVHEEELFQFRELTSMPGSLTSLDHELFWTNQNEKSLYWTALSGNQYIDRKIKLDVPFPFRQMHLATVVTSSSSTSSSSTSSSSSSNACSAIGGCTDVCVRRGATVDRLLHWDSQGGRPACACAAGRLFTKDDLRNGTCESRAECGADEARCAPDRNGCVNRTHLCDGKRDCAGGEDERECDMLKYHICHYDEFACNNGSCIDRKDRCNGRNDCVDGSDEQHCEHFADEKECSSSEFRCSSGICLNNDHLCNGISDCPEGEDEHNCNMMTCKKNQFSCGSGMCIPENWVCDGSNDCVDQSDENQNCPPLYHEQSCQLGMFKCGSGECITMKKYCDQNHDCSDGSDEVDCPSLQSEIECGEYEYQCESSSTTSEKCLPISVRCNGKKDCAKGEDEVGCPQSHEYDFNACGIDSFQCKSGSCISQKHYCDGLNDCPDKSDEDPVTCLKYEQHLLKGISCASKKCQHKCVLAEPTAICTCPDGQKLADDERSCVAPTNCDSDPPPPCQQICKPSGDKSYVCDCFEGFALRLDGVSCKSVGGPATLLYATGDAVRRRPLFYGGQVERATPVASPPRGVASLDSLALYSDESLSRIWLVNGSDETQPPRDIRLRFAGNPTHLAADPIARNVYYASDAPEKAIGVCSVQAAAAGGGGCSIVARLGSDVVVTALAVDPVNRLVFYATHQPSTRGAVPVSVLVKMSTDGSDGVPLLERNATTFEGLAVDPHRRLVYVSDTGAGAVDSVDYSGDKAKTVLRDLSQPRSLGLFEDRLYAVLAPARRLHACRLLRGASAAQCAPVELGASADSPVRAFAIVQRRPAGGADPCGAGAACAGRACVQSAATSAKCLCEDGAEVAAGGACKPAKIVNRYSAKKPDAAKTGSALIVMSIMFCVCALIVGAVFLYKCQKRRLEKSMEQDLSVHFHNPDVCREMSGFSMGLSGFSSMFPTFARPVHSECTNPLGPNKLVPADWPPSITIHSSDSHLKKKAGERNQLEVPKLLADSDSDVESDRDLHDGDYKETTKLLG